MSEDTDRKDWEYEVANGDTVLGFDEWLDHRAEAEDEEPEYVETLTKDEMWDSLIEQGVTERTLQIVTAINGYSTETMVDVLYAATGYRSFDQLED